MKVKLAYGKEGLWVELRKKNVTVIEPKFVMGVADEKEALRQALSQPINSPPLRVLVKPEDSVAIVFSDITRPQPRQLMLSAWSCPHR